MDAMDSGEARRCHAQVIAYKRGRPGLSLVTGAESGGYRDGSTHLMLVSWFSTGSWTEDHVDEFY